MLREYGLYFPYWIVYEIMNGVYGFIRMLLFEDQRQAKIKAALRGTIDGFCRRMDRCFSV